MASNYEEVQGYKWNEEFLRSAGVIALVNNGGEISNSTIPSNLGVNLRIVQHICKKLEDTWDEGQGNRHRRQGDEDDPTRSMKAMSSDLGCHEKTTRDCVSEDLRCRSYKMQ
ncbi:Uncharacterized protein FKW44_018592, partial [Caligus rogercresseyi]